MLKFAGHLPSGRVLLGIGLTPRNIAQLQEDRPILLELDQLLAERVETLVIFAGDSEFDMAARLGAIGAIGDDTQIRFEREEEP
jgi:hypothetical protein